MKTMNVCQSYLKHSICIKSTLGSIY